MANYNTNKNFQLPETITGGNNPHNEKGIQYSTLKYKSSRRFIKQPKKNGENFVER